VAEDCVSTVHRILRRYYADHDHYNKRNPLLELLFIYCSVRTSERAYLESYRAIRQAFPRLEMLKDADEGEVAGLMARAGLAKQKAAYMKEAVLRIARAFGRVSLAPLRHMDNPECEEFLRAFPGVGKKVARCIMMYSLERQLFPVDAHCWRICRRLGWVRKSRKDGTCTDRDMDRLQARVPGPLRKSLHVNMVSLGREFCVSGKPRCGECPIACHCRKVGVSRAYHEERGVRRPLF